MTQSQHIANAAWPMLQIQHVAISAIPFAAITARLFAAITAPL